MILRRFRSFAAPLLAGFALSACARMGVEPLDWPWQPPAAPVPDRVEVPEPRPARATAVARPAKPAERKVAEKKPEPEAPKLVGLSEAETAQLLGRPAEENEQPPGKVWLYKAAGCRLAVHLFPDMEKGGFYTLETTAEEGSRDACVGKLAEDARKKD